MSEKVKNKVFVLPIIDKNNTQNLRSNLEEDIKFYGILSLENVSKNTIDISNIYILLV